MPKTNPVVQLGTVPQSFNHEAKILFLLTMRSLTMNTFANAVRSTPVTTTTENGMPAQVSSMNALVDMFYKIGASRGRDVTPMFEKAFQEDQELALRIAQWARDVRGGAGERKIFRDILLHLEIHHGDVLINTKLLDNIATIGRFDDLLVFNYDPLVKAKAFGIIESALASGNGLCAKWMPRKGDLAVELRKFLKWTPKQYRKTLVSLTKVVETQMCAKDWNNINFSHVPSVAMGRYMKAFGRNAAEKWVEYKSALVKGEAKINAGAVYPYNLIKNIREATPADLPAIDAQWKALTNYVGEASMLPMVDVSGSMTSRVAGEVTALDVAVSLGLYLSDKNAGAFKDMFLTFSARPEILTLRGTLSQKLSQMEESHWEMNTNLESAFARILDVAVRGKVSAAEMPKYLLILSDMQFDQCVYRVAGAMEMIREQYASAGYTVPAIVFWNINSRDNTPVSFNEQGAALVSGFSPSIMKAILSADYSKITPEAIMKEAIMIPRYDL